MYRVQFGKFVVYMNESSKEQLEKAVLALTVDPTTDVQEDIIGEQTTPWYSKEGLEAFEKAEQDGYPEVNHFLKSEE